MSELTQEPKRTKMVADPKAKVKLKTLREVRLADRETVVQAGNVIEVTKEQADELLQPLSGGFDEYGNRHVIRRVEQVA